MDFKDWFQIKLDKHETNATKVAEDLDENQPTLQRILSGETRNPRHKLTKKIEAYFNKLEGNSESFSISAQNTKSPNQAVNPLSDRVKVIVDIVDKLDTEHADWLLELNNLFDVIPENDKAEILSYARYRYDISTNTKNEKKNRPLLHGLKEVPVRTYSDGTKKQASRKKENP